MINWSIDRQALTNEKYYWISTEMTAFVKLFIIVIKRWLEIFWSLVFAFSFNKSCKRLKKFIVNLLITSSMLF